MKRLAYDRLSCFMPELKRYHCCRICGNGMSVKPPRLCPPVACPTLQVARTALRHAKVQRHSDCRTPGSNTCLRGGGWRGGQECKGCGGRGLQQLAGFGDQHLKSSGLDGVVLLKAHAGVLPTPAAIHSLVRRVPPAVCDMQWHFCISKKYTNIADKCMYVSMRTCIYIYIHGYMCVYMFMHAE